MQKVYVRHHQEKCFFFFLFCFSCLCVKTEMFERNDNITVSVYVCEWNQKTKLHSLCEHMKLWPVCCFYRLLHFFPPLLERKVLNGNVSQTTITFSSRFFSSFYHVWINITNEGGARWHFLKVFICFKLKARYSEGNLSTVRTHARTHTVVVISRASVKCHLNLKQTFCLQTGIWCK